jgi:hypothetical protein
MRKLCPPCSHVLFNSILLAIADFPVLCHLYAAEPPDTVEERACWISRQRQGIERRREHTQEASRTLTVRHRISYVQMCDQHRHGIVR